MVGAVIFLALVAVLVATRGGGDATGGGGDAVAPDTRPSAKGDSATFAWLRPSVVPAGWTTVRLRGLPTRLPVPPGWESAESDVGTRTVVSRAPSGHIVGYLNATPLQGSETAANWSDFRVDHNREEGDRDVRLLASATGLRFRSATGACVLDSYLTITGNRYREIACIVSGRSATTVIVAAAPPSRWAGQAPTLQRALSSYTT